MSSLKHGPDWAPLRGVHRQALREARLQAHYAVQWLARTARAFVPPQPEDGHTNLGWDDALGGFTTHPLNDGARLSLRITDLALHAGEGSAKAFALDGRTDAQARQWLGDELAARGLDARKLDAPLPYDMPAHALSQGAPYGARSLAEALAELATWFGNAALSLAAAQNRMVVDKLEASPVRCWPHHFDLATLTTLPTRNAGVTGYVGIGLSPGDEHYDEPYFYVSIHPMPDPTALPNLPMLGHWHQHGFTAAIATAGKILGCTNRQAETESLLRCAVDQAIKLLR